jgi:hypothetical protein
MTWFVKRRRAQHPDDYETWQQGGVSPTLNAFDNTGDSRATVIVFQPGQMIRLGGGVWENIVPTLRAESKRGDNEPHMVIFTAQRVGEPPRIYDDTTPSLLSRMGTRGNNVPMIATNEPIAFDSNASGSFKVHADGQSPPVKIGSALGIPSPPAVAIPIQDGRDMEKRQNGLGIGDEGGPSYTLDQTGAQAVAYDEYNDTINPDIHHAIRAGTKQSTGVISDTVVRRLTPLECERLMGWPDNHTLHRADGKTNSDSTRYKMCGNGVASPVAEWIARQLLPLLT